MLATLTPLDEPALIRILTEPRNALTKQFQKMLAADGVELIFREEALKLIAHEAMARRTGARALRSILEETMMNVMFDVPSLNGVAQCIIEEETIREKSEPTLVTRAELLSQSREAKEQEAEIETAAVAAAA